MIDFILLLAVALVCFSLTAAFKEIQKDLRRAKENEGFSEAFLEHQRWVAENTETYRPGTFANFLTCYDRVKDSLSESTGSTAEFVNDPLQTPTRIGSIHVVFSGPAMRICPRCGVANATANLTCHMCGLDFSSPEAHGLRERHLPTMIDGNLVAVTSDGMARRVDEMIDKARRDAEVDVLDKKTEPVRLSKEDRTEYLAGGLFAGVMKRKAFNEALEGFRR